MTGKFPGRLAQTRACSVTSFERATGHVSHHNHHMHGSAVARTPTPPYYAVIFPSQRTDGDHGYAQMADRMVELAATMPGFLGLESARNSDGFGLTVSYWQSEEHIGAWKAHAEHRVAQEIGRQTWYADFSVRIAKVERAYGRHG